MISKSFTYKIYLRNYHFYQAWLNIFYSLVFFHLFVILHASEMDWLLSQTHQSPSPTTIPYKQRWHDIFILKIYLGARKIA